LLSRLAEVETTVPMLMPDKMHKAPPASKSRTLPWNGTQNANLRTPSAMNIMRHNRQNNGVILAMMISEVLAGDMSNCSSVPASVRVP